MILYKFNWYVPSPKDHLCAHSLVNICIVVHATLGKGALSCISLAGYINRSFCLCCAFFVHISSSLVQETEDILFIDSLNQDSKNSAQ